MFCLTDAEGHTPAYQPSPPVAVKDTMPTTTQVRVGMTTWIVSHIVV